MPARAVVLPGTSLLVPGAGGGADRVGEVRRAVDAALDRLVADVVAPTVPGGDGDVPLVVLAPVPRGAAGGYGRRRPSLAGAGVADRWVPEIAGWPDDDHGGHGEHGLRTPAAHVPASVGLVALRAALVRAGRPGRPDAVVLELSGAAPAEGVAALRRARAVVVAGGAAPGTPGAAAGDDAVRDPGPLHPVRLDPAVAAALQVAVAPGSWAWRVTSIPGGHEHLPATYRVAEGTAG
ncbi:hypothetical protein [Krasilnikoviella flava]|uniref:Peptidase C31 domain-containing protein n=1 Tax=Krasilnikoviella flava TaxID=526729 RepID=A0A1T5LTJ6_9MICO|nr:hypothetical protein [Krasilnikoviella flava]SKC79296.1 hypothetical protein SAMN04324258_3919 [Krasilnikoviella flava]